MMQTTKVCSKCKLEQPVDQFPGKRNSWCKECRRKAARSRYYKIMADPERRDEHTRRSTERSRKWREENPDRYRAKSREYSIKTTYNITLDEYAALLAEQGGRCAVAGCDREPKHIDHDHSCCPYGKSCGACIRGILCGGCNWLIGHADESPDRLRAAAQYLERTKVRNV